MNKNKKRFDTHSKEYDYIKQYVVHSETTLLEFLLSHLKGLSRNNIKSILKNHQVAVDGAPISQFDFKLYKEDVVIVSKGRIGPKKKEKLPILYEDDEIIVINKPHGLLSIASDKEKGKTAYRMLTDYVQEKDKHNRIFVVHRLDRETSGVLMVAKSSELRDALQKDWNDLVTKRGYYAVVEGILKDKERDIVTFLKKNKLNLMYETDDKVHGKKSVTHYKVLKESKDYSLLDVKIDTGRKNQIRVQLGNLGHYVIGDDKYGEPSNPIGRLGLHAYELDIIHPFTKKKMSFKCSMPKEFSKLFEL